MHADALSYLQTWASKMFPCICIDILVSCDFSRGRPAPPPLSRLFHQTFLDSSKAAPPMVVGTVLFGQPNVGDSVLVAAYNRHVNARRVVFEYVHSG